MNQVRNFKRRGIHGFPSNKRKARPQWQVFYKHDDPDSLKDRELAAKRAINRLAAQYPGSYVTVSFSFGAFVVAATTKRVLLNLPETFGKFSRTEPERTSEFNTAFEQ